jgi:integrase
MTLEGVPLEVLQIAENIMAPGNHSGWRNPWRSDFVQLRNYLLWRIFLDTGGRRGEVHGIKVNDVSYPMRRVHILESKTKARTVPIQAHTAEVFDRFVEAWSKIDKCNRAHGYLFTNETGGHLSLRQINRIFEVLRKSSGQMLPDYLTPHTVRRAWNDILSAKIDSLPEGKRIKEEEEIQIRNRLQGWSDKSKMGGKYARRHIREKGDRISEQLMESIGPLKIDDDIPY